MFGLLDIQDANDNDGSEAQLLCLLTTPLRMNSHRLSSSSDSLSLKRVARQSYAQRWELTAGGYSGNAAAFFIHQIVAGVTEVVFVRPPLTMKRGNAAVGLSRETVSTVLPNGSKEITFSKGTALLTSGATPGASSLSAILNTNSVVCEGDFIKFQNHSKLYLVTGVAVTNVPSHAVTISVFPNLIGTVTISEQVNLGLNASMTAVYNTDTVNGIAYQDGMIADIGSVQLVEQL